jgi:hypothetical protein
MKAVTENTDRYLMVVKGQGWRFYDALPLEDKDGKLCVLRALVVFNKGSYDGEDDPLDEQTQEIVRDFKITDMDEVSQTMMDIDGQEESPLETKITLPKRLTLYLKGCFEYMPKRAKKTLESHQRSLQKKQKKDEPLFLTVLFAPGSLPFDELKD